MCDSSIGDTPISMYRGNSYCVIVGKTRLCKIVSGQIISIELRLNVTRIIPIISIIL